MDILLDIDKVKTENIWFLDKIKNNIIEESDFIGLHYSDEILHLNNIIVSTYVYNVTLDSYFNKYKLFYPAENNIDLLKLVRLEKSILEKYNSIESSIPKYRLGEQILNKELKIICDKDVKSKYKSLNIKLKISGLWDDGIECGIIYKFYV